MKTIIAGSRSIKRYSIVKQAILESKFKITRIVSGRARGVDYLGEVYARINKIPIDPFPAKWEKYGKAAGAIRNQLMAQNADALIAVWDGESPGTANMIKLAKENNLKIFIKIIKE